jgi:predicted MFS family arabinose efflux permease
MRLFRISVFANICLIMLLFGAAFFGAIIYVPTFAQQVLGFSATNSGVILLPMVIGLTLASVSMGRLVNKTGKYKIIVVAGLIVATLGVLSLSGLTQQSNYWDLAWRIGLAGFGMGMSMPIFNLAAQNAVEQGDLGVATS